MQTVIGPYRDGPAQPVDASADQRMRAEGPSLDREAHGNGGGVPSRGSEPPEQGLLGGFVVEMHRLRIELRREPLDVGLGDVNFGGFELHSNGEIVEPLDPRHDSPRNVMRRLAAYGIEQERDVAAPQRTN